MAPPRGRRAEAAHRPRRPPAGGEGSWLCALGRFTGFALFAALAVTILAGMVLVPAYARLAQARHERACQQVILEDLRARCEAGERHIQELSRDPALTTWLLASHWGLQPAREVILADPDAAPVPVPRLVRTTPLKMPTPPGGRLLRAADKLRRPATRRGLFFVAALSLAAAMLLFAPPATYRRRQPRLP